MIRTSLALAVALGVALVPSTANAGKCDYIAKKADSAKGASLVSAYKQMLRCSADEAKASYVDFMKNSGDIDTLIDLSVTAINGKAYAEVWGSTDKMTDFSQRKDLAKGVGAACKDNAEVVTFLKGAFFGLRPIQLGHWADAYVTCESDEIATFIEAQIKAPPKRTFDEKYNTVLKIWTDRNGKAALPVLGEAAVVAAAEGPFNAVLDAMNASVQPTGLGQTITDDDRKLLQDALVGVAGKVSAEQARFVADGLFNAGAEEAAASLLPVIYKDRVQADGSLLYGVASVESCDGQAILHYATVSEAGKRWSIIADVEGPARGFKAKLKCETDGDWPVLVTPEPVGSAGDVADWAKARAEEWTAKGTEAKLKAEKAVSL